MISCKVVEKVKEKSAIMRRIAEFGLGRTSIDTEFLEEEWENDIRVAIKMRETELSNQAIGRIRKCDNAIDISPFTYKVLKRCSPKHRCQACQREMQVWEIKEEELK